MTNIKCTVEITRNSDGVVRLHDWEWNVDGQAEWERENNFKLDPFYIWSDGNYACDCNRGLFFAQAADEPDPDAPCGTDLYSVQIREPYGSVVYKDGGFESQGELKTIEVTPDMVEAGALVLHKVRDLMYESGEQAVMEIISAVFGSSRVVFSKNDF